MDVVIRSICIVFSSKYAGESLATYLEQGCADILLYGKAKPLD